VTLHGDAHAAVGVGAPPELSLVVQAVALCAAIGTAIAVLLFRGHRDAERRWEIVAHWTVVGLVVGLLTVVVSTVARVLE